MAKEICGKIGTAMHSLSPATSDDSETEYRAIEAALLESARGRWFLAEHGRRARRLDSALLDDAISRLQTSLRQPPALLGQLKAEIETLKAHLAETRASLLAKAAPSGSGEQAPTHGILKAAEEIHDIAWSLQANPFDPKGCEEIAKNAGRLYVLSQSQAIESERTLKTANAIDAAAHRLEAMLETVIHELQIDHANAGSA
jgi:multidrug resistance efflux pump